MFLALFSTFLLRVLQYQQVFLVYKFSSALLRVFVDQNIRKNWNQKIVYCLLSKSYGTKIQQNNKPV